MNHPNYTPDEKPAAQILRGLGTGLKLSFWLLVVLVLVTFTGVHFLKKGNSPFDEAPESVVEHYDIRRNIAMAYGSGDAQENAGSSQQTSPVVEEKSNTWDDLKPIAVDSDNPHGFQSKVMVYPMDDTLHFRVMIGPYDPDISRELKKSSGWVALTFHQANGLPVPELDRHIKIDTSSFEFYQSEGNPIGWVCAGQLEADSDSDLAAVQGYSLGWVVPGITRSQNATAESHAGIRRY